MEGSTKMEYDIQVKNFSSIFLNPNQPKICKSCSEDIEGSNVTHTNTDFYCQKHRDQILLSNFEYDIKDSICHIMLYNMYIAYKKICSTNKVDSIIDDARNYEKKYIDEFYNFKLYMLIHHTEYYYIMSYYTLESLKNINIYGHYKKQCWDQSITGNLTTKTSIDLEKRINAALTEYTCDEFEKLSDDEDISNKITDIFLPSASS